MTAPQFKFKVPPSQSPQSAPPLHAVQDPGAPKTVFYESKDGTLTAVTTRPINGVLSAFTIQDSKGRQDFGVSVDIFKLAEKFAKAPQSPSKPPSPKLPKGAQLDLTYWNSLYRSLEKYVGELPDSLPDFFF